MNHILQPWISQHQLKNRLLCIYRQLSVLLLYRDEYYNKASTRKGEADLILGKNRSGATGEIAMIWTGEYMKFREKRSEDEVSE